MTTMYLFFFLLALFFVNSKNISPKILCRDCKHFIPATFNLAYNIGEAHGKCGKYVRYDIIDAEPEYEFAIYVRNDINKCGKEGVYFSKKPTTFPNIFSNVFPE